ncbi:MAG: gluconate 2-dehydrogenase subunit 3 family protein [Verrucomicrobia bacterium]|nr:gluconate 2-dehydrogenase subunit 3 family protein [Verrucomicrobiota bacterium]
MLSSALPHTTDSLTRREALRRAALLLGVAFTPSILAAATGAAPTAGTAPVAPAPALIAAERAVVAAVAERLLPRTDTPGALDAGVPEFIDRLVGAYFTDAERRTFREGVAALDRESGSRAGGPFASRKPEQQDTLLASLAEDAVGRGTTFYSLVREATIVGYFTSELVGKTVLHYDPVPGRFDACIPISEVGNVAWTR